MPVGTLAEHWPMTAATSAVARTSAGYFLSAFGSVIAARIVGAPIGPRTDSVWLLTES